jgi:hypothetical protein
MGCVPLAADKEDQVRSKRGMSLRRKSVGKRRCARSRDTRLRVVIHQRSILRIRRVAADPLAALTAAAVVEFRECG